MFLLDQLRALRADHALRQSRKDVHRALLENHALSPAARKRALAVGTLRTSCERFTRSPADVDQGLPIGAGQTAVLTAIPQRAGWLRDIQLVFDPAAIIDLGAVYFGGIPQSALIQAKPQGLTLSGNGAFILPGQMLQITLTNVNHGCACHVRGWFTMDEVNSAAWFSTAFHLPRTP